MGSVKGGSRSRSRQRSRSGSRERSRSRERRPYRSRSRGRSRSRDRRRGRRSRSRSEGYYRYSDAYWREQGGPEYRVARDGTMYYYSRRGGRPFEIRAGDWTCERCRQNNFARNRECYRCREVKGNAEDTMDVCRKEGIRDRSRSRDRGRRRRSRSSSSRSRSRSPRKRRSRSRSRSRSASRTKEYSEVKQEQKSPTAVS